MTTVWPDKAPDSELFDRINAHISEYTDDIAIKNICAEFQQEIEQLRARVAELEQFVRAAHPFALSYAQNNPIHSYNGQQQDPQGVHAWLRDVFKTAPQQEQETGRE